MMDLKQNSAPQILTSAVAVQTCTGSMVRGRGVALLRAFLTRLRHQRGGTGQQPPLEMKSFAPGGYLGRRPWLPPPCWHFTKTAAHLPNAPLPLIFGSAQLRYLETDSPRG